MVNTDTNKKGLGRGAASLFGSSNTTRWEETLPGAKAPATKSVEVAIPTAATQAVSDENRIWKIAIDKISANQFQPREKFDEQKLKELADSIKEQGILLPLVVRKSVAKPGTFELIAGERRWRAAQLAGLHEVPAMLRNIDDQKSLELALIENIQRHDLNAIEEAEAYQRLAEEFDLTQAEIAQKVGKDRATVANIMRLNSLAPEVKTMLVDGALTVGHAKVLLAVADLAKQRDLAKKIVGEKLTVRAAEGLVAVGAKAKPVINVDISKRMALGLKDELQKVLGTKVTIDYNAGKGKLSLHFYTDDQLNNLVDRLKT